MCPGLQLLGRDLRLNRATARACELVPFYTHSGLEPLNINPKEKKVNLVTSLELSEERWR